MSDNRVFTLLLLAVFLQGCKEPVHEKEIVTSGAETQTQKMEDGFLLTKDETRMALIKMNEINEKKYEKLKSDPFHGYGSSDDFENTEEEKSQDHLNDNRDLDEDYLSADEYEDWKDEDVVLIEIARRTGKAEFINQWECNLKLGLFRKSEYTPYSFNIVHGYFDKSKTGEWTATSFNARGGSISPR